MLPSLALTLPALAPALLAGALAWPRAGRAALALAPFGALPALLVAVLSPDAVLDLPWLLLGTRLRLDGPSRIFLLLAGAVWLAAGVHARGYVERERRRGFFGWWNLALSGSAGLTVCGDAASFYLAFALMSFASYGLVVHARTPAAIRAGRVYLAMVIVGEIFVFAALVMGAAEARGVLFDAMARAMAGSPRRTLFTAMALLGFGVKAGVLGLHVWLPLAHPEAPTPASAVLSAVMVKAGLIGWMNVLPAAALPNMGGLVLVVGILGAFYGVAVGLTQRDPKAILAYSTVSQMGVVAAGVGAALADPGARAASLSALPLFALHHGLAKGALFLGVGVARGGGRAGRAAALALAAPALALAAAPFASGAFAKGEVKDLVAASVAGGPGAKLLLAVSSAATALLLAHLLREAIREAAGGVHQHRAGRDEVLAFAALVAGAVILPFAAAGPGALAESAAKDLAPVAAGAAAAWALRGFPVPQVPPGDVLALYSRLGRRARLPLSVAPEPAPGHQADWAGLAAAWCGLSERRLLVPAASGALLAGFLVVLFLLFGR